MQQCLTEADCRDMIQIEFSEEDIQQLLDSCAIANEAESRGSKATYPPEGAVGGNQ